MVDLEAEFKQLIINTYELIRVKRSNGKISYEEANHLSEMVKSRTGYDSLGVYSFIGSSEKLDDHTETGMCDCSSCNPDRYPEDERWSDRGWSSSGCSF